MASKIESHTLITIKKIKPLIVLDDENHPNLNYNGTRVIAGHEIGISVVFDVDTGKKLGRYYCKDSSDDAISVDGKIVKIFAGSENYCIYDVDSGKLIHQENSDISKDGEHSQSF